ncbi:MAG TPA: hypothetical protein VGX97_10835 [bacterium]|nr:hypothetical protein [bacterium]
MSDHYWMEKVAYGKQAEGRELAARYWLSVKAQAAQGTVRRPAAAPLAGVLRIVGHTLGFGRTVLTAAAHGPKL